MSKKYKASDLNIHAYGRGHGKRFIMYTDFIYEEGIGPRWHTRVYPDICGNVTKAVTQTLRWLNKMNVPSPNVVRNSPEKLALVYNQFGCPNSYFETDDKGEVI
jgi:hypothetical protein